jgi:hypothetical protein
LIAVAINITVVIIGPGAEQSQPLNEHGTNQHSRGRDVVTSSRGNDTDYLTARIARDHPELLEAVRRGEYSTVAWARTSTAGSSSSDNNQA